MRKYRQWGLNYASESQRIPESWVSKKIPKKGITQVNGPRPTKLSVRIVVIQVVIH